MNDKEVLVSELRQIENYIYKHLSPQIKQSITGACYTSLGTIYIDDLPTEDVLLFRFPTSGGMLDIAYGKVYLRKYIKDRKHSEIHNKGDHFRTWINLTNSYILVDIYPCAGNSTYRDEVKTQDIVTMLLSIVFDFDVQEKVSKLEITKESNPIIASLARLAQGG